MPIYERQLVQLKYYLKGIHDHQWALILPEQEAEVVVEASSKLEELSGLFELVSGQLRMVAEAASLAELRLLDLDGLLGSGPGFLPLGSHSLVLSHRRTNLLEQQKANDQRLLIK